MNKAEFLDKLCQGLRFQADPDEIRRVVAFYDQAIDDRVEDGMTEEDAVAALGDLSEIIRGVKDAWEQEPKSRPEEDVPPGDAVRRHFDPAVSTRFEIFDTSLDVHLLPSPDGQVHLEYPSGSRWRYEITGESVVTIRRSRKSTPPEQFNFDIFGVKFSFNKPDFGFFTENASLKLLLPAAAPVAVSVNTASGNLTAERVRLASLSAALASGDVELRDVEAEGRLSASSASGNVDAARLTAPEIALTSASGDVELADIRCGSLTAKSASGDVDLENISPAEKLTAGAVSGDVSAGLDIPCPELTLETVSGDIELSLPGPESLYTVMARSSSGDVRIGGDALTGPNRVRIKALSGDIDVSFGG